ncbi:MAG: GAF domain-containing protein [Chloroflexi bacterium]|nr:GAF domain-containing protein [Chloroflexota bacterium]
MTYRDLLTADERHRGMLYFGGARMALLDIEAGFWGLRRQMESLVGRRLTDAVLQQAGAHGGASFARSFIGRRAGEDGRRALRDCIAAYQAAGFGRFEVEVLKWPIGRVVIRAQDTFEAWMVRRHGGKSESPVCAYSAGVLVGFVNVIAGRQDVVCVEHACQAQGADVCVFELLSAEAAGDTPAVTLAPDPILDRQLNLLEILFDRMPMGIAIFDRDLRLRRCNPTWVGFIDRYTPSRASHVVPGTHFFDLAPGTEDAAMPIFQRVLAGETVRLDALRLESGGIVSYWDVVFTPLIEDGAVIGFVDVTTDATERVLANQELQQTIAALQESQQLLEQRVAERTRELSTLLQISRDMASTLELEPLLGLVLDQLRAVVEYSGASIMTLDGDTLKVIAYRGPLSQEEALQISFPLDEARANREVVLREEPVLIDDIWGDTPLARALRATAGGRLKTTFGYIRSWLGVPLIVKERVIGMLTLDHERPGVFTPQHAELVLTFANQVAVAIENARLYQTEQERQRELQMLLDVAAAASSSLELDEMLSNTLDRLVALVGASRAGVVLLDRESGELEPRMLRPDRPIAPEDMAEVIQACQRVIAEGKPLYVPPNAELGYAEPGALLPLRARGQALGVLAIIGPKGSTFNERQLALFESIADQLGVAVENARLYEQTERAAAAAERNRLARELHDAVTQTLFSAGLIAEVLPRLWQRDPEEGRRRLEELRQLTRGALAEMRTLLLELRPAAVIEANLGDLLRQLAEATTGRARVPVSVAIDGACTLPPDVQVALYRIAQEALNNVAKHADASRAEVALRCSPGQVKLSVRDDGRGFHVGETAPDHLGLSIMRERAEAIGARLEVKSKIGRGTEVAVVWERDDRRRITDD